MKSSQRQCPEAALADPVADWLESRGLTVYAEVPIYGRWAGCDIVGVSEELLVAVELKTTLSSNVIRQAYMAQIGAHEAWAGVATMPKPASIERATRHGIGVLRVTDGVVEVLAAATGDRSEYRTDIFTQSLEKNRDLISRLTPGRRGGVPCLPGEGPAQDVYRAVQAFLEKHPGTPYRVLYREIPNHYASAKSMCGAMRMVEERNARRV